MYAVIPLVIVIGAAIGLINGILVGYLRLRAFLTTLVTLVFIRAIVDLLATRYAIAVSASTQETPVWDFLGDGAVVSVPIDLIVALAVAAIGHIVLTRLRFQAGICLPSAAHDGPRTTSEISVRRVVCLTYVISGALTACGAIFYAARLTNASGQTGVGLEIIIITAAILGGNSLGGRRGSTPKALLGTIIVLIVTNGVVSLGLRSGAGSLVLGLILLFAVAVDMRWVKIDFKILHKTYISPAYFAVPACPSMVAGSQSPYAQNDKLSTARGIGVDELDGPEDVVFDQEDNLYCGNRHGDVVRFFPPHYNRHELHAHIGGMTADSPWTETAASSFVLQASASPASPGREELSGFPTRPIAVFGPSSTIRACVSQTISTSLPMAASFLVKQQSATIGTTGEQRDSSRGNGRIICYNPHTKTSRTVLRHLMFPNGICLAFDGQSILFAETFGYRINRYWFDGPKAGAVEPVMTNLPGLPDNINRASDGNYWCAIAGLRGPAMDLSLRMPDFRRRMIYRVAPDEWLFAQMNTGFVFKFNLQGEVLDALWDRDGSKHSVITSMREHRGYLYLGGLTNNRLGQFKLQNADVDWTGPKSYWGAN